MLYNPEGAGIDPKIVRELRKIAEVLAIVDKNTIRFLTAAPEKPRMGDVAICDGTNWNPIADGVRRPIWFDETSGVWRRFTF
jgi:hypothetical protein